MLPIRDRLPTRTVPFVTYAIIVVNVLAYLWESALVEAGYGAVVGDFGLVPLRLLGSPVEQAPTVLTSMFMHGGLAHLVGNMWFLWIFGDNVEDALGHVRFIAFYLLGGVAAAIAQLAVDPGSTVPVIGASGAIAAVLAGYLSLYPRSPITMMIPPFFWLLFDLPAWAVALYWFALNLVSGLGSLGRHATGGVAFFAHIGGFIAGLLLVRAFMIGRERMRADPWRGWRPPPGRPRTDDRWRGYQGPPYYR